MSPWACCASAKSDTFIDQRVQTRAIFCHHRWTSQQRWLTADGYPAVAARAPAGAHVHAAAVGCWRTYISSNGAGLGLGGSLVHPGGVGDESLASAVGVDSVDKWLVDRNNDSMH